MSSKTNVLFILIDDMGWKDICSYGSEFYETPNLDRLRKEGMLFTNAYASCPVCSPTRASILSGKYPATIGMTQFIRGVDIIEQGKVIAADYLHYLPLEEKSLASALKEHGYSTYHIGKWHLGSRPYWPEHHGFDVNIGGCDWGMPSHGYFSPYKNPSMEDGPDGEYLTDRLSTEAISLIENHTDPYFMYLSYYAVHNPIQAPADLIKKYEKKRKDLGLDKVKEFEIGDHFPSVHKRGKIKRRLVQSNPAYAAIIERLDWNIGRVLESIEKRGELENTIVFFFSDNGGLATAEGSPTCNFPLSEGKGWMYEGGTREPLLVRWPEKIMPNSECCTPITSTDFYPTILDALGLPLIPEQHCDGVSILPLLKDGCATLDRDAIFWHYPHYGNQGGTPGSSIISGDYKLLEFYEDDRLELYNLKEDIGEKHNLINDELELAKVLYNKLCEWKESVNAKIPEKNSGYPACFAPVNFISTDEKFILNEDGVIYCKKQIYPKNPLIFDIPLVDFLEEFLDVNLDMEIVRNKGTDQEKIEKYQGKFQPEEEKLMWVDAITESVEPLSTKFMVDGKFTEYLSIIAWKLVDKDLKIIQPEKLKVNFTL